MDSKLIINNYNCRLSLMQNCIIKQNFIEIDFQNNGIWTANHHVAYTKVGKHHHTSHNYVNGSCSLHAEISLVLKIKNYKKIKKIHVARFNKKGKYIMSRPCDKCINILKHYTNIKKIYYTNELAEWEVIKLNCTENTTMGDLYWHTNKKRLMRKIKNR